MKKILLTLSCFICASAMYAAVVKGNIGQGTFVDWEGNSSAAYGLDFDKDGTIDFKLSSSGYEPEHQNCYIEYDPGAGHVVLTKSIMNTGSGWDNVQPLVSGSSVNSTSNYWGSLGDANVVDFTGTCHVPIGQDCYIGFKFGKNGNIHYGFARLEVNGNSTTGYTATWKECFYENTPNTPIETGVLASVSSAYSSSLNVYPNPAKGEINIVGINSSSKVEIFNTLGVCVKEVHGYVSGESIDLSNLVKGIYVVRIHHQGKTETKHIVKQ